MKNATAILLLNTGSPNSPNPLNVARYLSRFLGDRRIITLPWVFRKLLVNCIIVPIRSFRSAARYRQLWNHFDGKFPLLHYGIVTKNLLQESLQNDATVFLGMRYGEPTIENQIKKIIEDGYDKIILVPLFPQYASSSSGSVLESALRTLNQYPLIPTIHTIQPFYNHPAFIHAFAEKIKSYNYDNYEQIIFTYHSLPLSHIQVAENTNYDYKKSCYQTTALIAKELDIHEDRFETTFQSQMSAKWQGPFVDKIIVEKAKQGIKSLMIVAPSFVADCLESTIELGEELKQQFLDNGGEKYQLVSSLNDSPLWIEALKQMLKKGF